MTAIPKSVQGFFNDGEATWTVDFKKETIPEFENNSEMVKWILFKSGWPYLPLILPGAPFEKMLAEAQALEDLFVGHRQDQIDFENSHRGWRSICLHGEAWNKTGYWTSYPENAGKRVEEVKFDWCPEITERCPETTRYFRDVFPNNSFQRLRYMWLEPQGYIQPHQDRQEHMLSPINVALNNPDGCVFKMKNKGVVPFKNSGNACLVDIGNMHSVWNNSDTPRIHIISHGAICRDFDQIVVDSLKALL
jgi:hypothetical protein